MFGSAGIFTINSQTGVLFPATLLVGRSKHHKLKVEARDVNGTGPNFAQTTVNIEIQQVNGNAPRIVTPMHRNSTIYVFEVTL